MKRNVIIIAGVIVAVVAIAIISSPSKASRRAAIERAFQYDSQIADQKLDDYFDKAGFIEVIGDIFGGYSHSYRDACSQYAARLRSIPLDGCPSDFKKVYRDHIAAWESFDKQAIEDTWYRVKTVAYSYGVANHHD